MVEEEAAGKSKFNSSVACIVNFHKNMEEAQVLFKSIDDNPAGVKKLFRTIYEAWRVGREARESKRTSGVSERQKIENWFEEVGHAIDTGKRNPRFKDYKYLGKLKDDYVLTRDKEKRILGVESELIDELNVLFNTVVDFAQKSGLLIQMEWIRKHGNVKELE